MKKTLIIILSALTLSPLGANAQQAPDAYQQQFGNFGIGSGDTRLLDMWGNSKVNDDPNDPIAAAMAKDWKSACNDTALGTNTDKMSWDNSEYNRGKSNSDSRTNINGQVKGGFGAWGGSGAYASSNVSSNAWNNGNATKGSIDKTGVVIGKDCSTQVKGYWDNKMNKTNNNTERLGILVNNETQRYSIDKQHQVAIKQIEAGQIQSVFGGGAKSMMGEMGR
jgi:hypothetical protein